MYNITLFGKPVNRLNSEKIIINRCSKREITVHDAEYNTWINNCKRQLRGKYKYNISGKIKIIICFYIQDGQEYSTKEMKIFSEDIIDMLKYNESIADNGLVCYYNHVNCNQELNRIEITI